VRLNLSYETGRKEILCLYTPELNLLPSLCKSAKLRNVLNFSLILSDTTCHEARWGGGGASVFILYILSELSTGFSRSVIRLRCSYHKLFEIWIYQNEKDKRKRYRYWLNI
jgi:hypothetical protein